MPRRLFEDVDAWTSEAKAKLDQFEREVDSPNYVNYDMLEVRDSSAPDVIAVGEQVVSQLEAVRDIRYSDVAKQVA